MSHPRSGRTLTLILGLLLAPTLGLLASCSNDDGGGDGDRDGDAESAEADCDLLTDEQLATVTGSEVESGPRTIDLQGVPACVWDAESGAMVQVADVEAGSWAQALPDLVEQAKSTGVFDDPAQLQKLEDAQDLIDSGSSVPDDKACDLFSTLVEIQGVGPGQDRVVNAVPSAEDPQGYSARAVPTDGSPRCSCRPMTSPGPRPSPTVSRMPSTPCSQRATEPHAHDDVDLLRGLPDRRGHPDSPLASGLVRGEPPAGLRLRRCSGEQ